MSGPFLSSYSCDSSCLLTASLIMKSCLSHDNLLKKLDIHKTPSCRQPWNTWILWLKKENQKWMQFQCPFTNTESLKETYYAKFHWWNCLFSLMMPSHARNRLYSWIF